MLNIPNLEVWADGNDPDTLINLAQDDNSGNVSSISLHRCQIALLAERVGVLAPDHEAQRTIARLSRQLRILLDRINTLDEWINSVAQAGRENLDLETAYSLATWELAREFVADLPEPNDPKFPVQRPQISGGTPPETGSLPAATPKEINGLPGDPAAGQLLDNRGSAAPLQPLHPTPAMAASVAKSSPADGTSQNPAQPELI